MTGGAGFIGSHLVDELIGRGHEVVVLDDLSTGRLDNLTQSLDKSSFRFVEGDIRDAKIVKAVTVDIDTVVHEAAITSVTRSMKDPETTLEVNVTGTLNLLKASLNHNVERFVYASSCAVYGEPGRLPISENANHNPISPYASTKLSAELSCLKFLEKGVDTVNLRYFNVYGPRQGGEYAGVITKFLDRIQNDEPPIIYGDGKQTRDFVHVSDVVEATSLALEREEAIGETINVGSGERTTIDRLCETLLEISGKQDLQPIRKEAREGDIRHSQADIAKAREILNYAPQVPLKRGLEQLYKNLEQ